ncbi:MAG: SMP-30/gluconolactonase/LRE family protein, partial [Pseudomonadota bacterium]|nr:SMP-30/gluconolactonase/LRE family protein [Pseudomonadota bacterium]
QQDAFSRDYQNAGHATPLGNCASICFGGVVLKSVYIGSLAGESVSTFRVDIAGAEPPHWQF